MAKEAFVLIELSSQSRIPQPQDNYYRETCGPNCYASSPAHLHFILLFCRVVADVVISSGTKYIGGHSGMLYEIPAIKKGLEGLKTVTTYGPRESSWEACWVASCGH